MRRTSRSVSRKALGTGAQEVWVGSGLPCARETDGTLWCWELDGPEDQPQVSKPEHSLEEQEQRHRPADQGRV